MSQSATSAALPAPLYPGFGEAFRVWARIGLISFGGPAGQIALMHKELVERRRWISETRFLHALNYCMLLPGPEAQQLAIYIGWLLHGTRGGIVAGTLFVLPGLLVILGLSASYALLQQTDWLASLFFGLKAAVLAIVIEAVMRIGRRALKNRVMLALAALAFVALFVFATPFPVVVVAAGLFGFFGTRIRPDIFAAPGHGASKVPDLPSVIDADFPDIAPSAGRAARIVAACGLLWVAPLFLIVPLWGWSNTFSAIMSLFSQMAVVTFGGAYAVLSYVAQQAVDTYGWLNPGEMLDGLALAETTPGPLVLVLSYVGFIAAFRSPMGLEPLFAGVIGAGLAAWVTFVPCFLWIFLGAPYIERLRSNAALSGALAAITGAVVGVILNLAVWFGLHVLFGEVGRLEFAGMSLALPDWRSFDPAAAVFGLAAVLMLFRFRFGVIGTLGACAASGLGLGFLDQVAF